MEKHRWSGGGLLSDAPSTSHYVIKIHFAHFPDFEMQDSKKRKKRLCMDKELEMW
jgi:hypothetical protein